MGMMTEYYHFIFTTLVMYLQVPQGRVGASLKEGYLTWAWASLLGTDRSYSWKRAKPS